MSGTVIGGINGSDIHLEVTRQGTNREYSPLILNGKVGPDNRGHGEYTYDQGSGSWDSIEALKCVPAPPKEEPKPAPAPEEEKPLAPDNAHPAIAVRALVEVVAQVGIYQIRDGKNARSQTFHADPTGRARFSERTATGL